MFITGLPKIIMKIKDFEKKKTKNKQQVTQAKNIPGTRSCQCLSALGYICIGKKLSLVPAQSKLISPPRLICLAFPSKQMLIARYSEHSLIKIDPLAVVAPQGSILSESSGSSPIHKRIYTSPSTSSTCLTHINLRACRHSKQSFKLF